MLESLNESKKLLPERVAEQIISLIADRALKTGDKPVSYTHLTLPTTERV